VINAFFIRCTYLMGDNYDSQSNHKLSQAGFGLANGGGLGRGIGLGDARLAQNQQAPLTRSVEDAPRFHTQTSPEKVGFVGVLKSVASLLPPLSCIKPV
jgi:hypothetical protein